MKNIQLLNKIAKVGTDNLDPAVYNIGEDVAAPEGIKCIQESHPEVDIYCGALDSHLNERGYIVPGLGDAGDRIFGTK